MQGWFRYWRDKAKFRLKTSDWRFWSVFFSTLAAIAITAIMPFLSPRALDVSGFWGAFFASWTSGVALFAFFGLIVAIASLSRPDKESFDTRARNFLRRQRGEHIEYMIKQLGETLEPYVEYTEKKLVVTGWHASEKKFQISHVTKASIRGFLEDIPQKFPGILHYIAGTTPPEGTEYACISYLRVNGEQKVGYQEFEKEFRHDFGCEAPKYGSCLVEHSLSYWVVADLRPNFPPAFGRVLGFQSGLMRPVFP